MTEPTLIDTVVYETPWFQLAARQVTGARHPHYVFKCTDFVVVVAVTKAGELLLVRQFRPARGEASLELVSGHVEIGETPEEAARKELLEETGHVAPEFLMLRTLAPCIGRFTNHMWCFLALDAEPTPDRAYAVEAGMEPVKYTGKVRDLLARPEFCSSLSHTALLAAMVHGAVRLD